MRGFLLAIAALLGADAGTEINTEDSANMAPTCQGLVGTTSDDTGTGISDPALAAGSVIIPYAGVAGAADLVPDVHAWNDPVAEVVITRVQ